MLRIKRFINLWLPVVVWCGFIFYLSSIPHLRASESPVWDEIIRSGLHLLFYAFLYLLFFRALNFKKKKKDYLLPFSLTLLYGLSDEMHQSFVPSRTFQLRDLVVDFLGGVLGGLSLWKLLPKAPKRLKSWAKRLAVV